MDPLSHKAAADKGEKYTETDVSAFSREKKFFASPRFPLPLSKMQQGEDVFGFHHASGAVGAAGDSAGDGTGEGDTAFL